MRVHVWRAPHLEVSAPCGQHDAVSREPRSLDDKRDVGVVARLVQVEEVSRDMLVVLHLAQSVEVDTDGGVPRRAAELAAVAHGSRRWERQQAPGSSAPERVEG